MIQHVFLTYVTYVHRRYRISWNTAAAAAAAAVKASLQGYQL
jgi:hypothetical protein